jgi:predicted NBD/HSP70 family sugar kinase
VQRGSNSIGVRRYNERLVLSTIRRREGASKAEVARLTGLSPQAVVRIVESLEHSGRLVRTGRRYGGLGQPAIMYRVNGDSGCTIGVEVGRDRLICMLLDFDGAILARSSHDVEFPRASDVIDQVAKFASSELAQLTRIQRKGFLGTGIAMPWFLGRWPEESELGAAAVEDWDGSVLSESFRRKVKGPILFENDGNAGALAEAFCGAGRKLRNFLYVHVGKFVGGGLVLGGELYDGSHGNAAALASMPVPGRGGADLLLHRASLYSAEETPAEKRRAALSNDWLGRCADALGFAILGVNSLLDLEAVLIGGRLSGECLESLIGKIRAYVSKHAPPDFFQPALEKGDLGEGAPAIGAGLLPLFSTFSPNLESLLK